MILTFGKYKGRKISEVEDDEYLKWLAKPKYSAKFYESEHSSELKFKVPLLVRIEARAVLETRGWFLQAETWDFDIRKVEKLF